MDNQFPLPGPITPSGGGESTPQTGESLPLPNPEEAAPPPPGYQPPAAVTPPVVKPSPLKIIVPILAGLIVVGLIVFGITKLFSGKTAGTKSATPGQAVTLTYYGLWEPSSVMKAVIDAFEKENPKIKISYQLQSPQDYQDRVKTSLESQNPPDIIRLHTTWLPIFAKNLLPAPPNTISSTEFTTNFYPIIGKLLMVNNQIYGVPITTEGLGLYINTAMFQQKSLQPPKTWEDLLTAAKTLKEVDPLTGKITRAGVALGNTTNVDQWPDIVSLMLMQAGVKMSEMSGDEVATTLTYYSDFVTKHRVWDETLPPSVVAFANEKVAMILAPSWRAREIKAINPSLAWQVVPVPQLPDADPVNWASIWFEGVSKDSKHPQEAWKFVTFLASANAQQILFDAATTDREFPQPPANKVAAATAMKNPVVAPFIASMDTAKTFYTASLTRDSKTAINSRLIKYLEDAINGLGQSQETAKVISTLSSGFAQVLSQYGLVTAPTPTPTP